MQLSFDKYHLHMVLNSISFCFLFYKIHKCDQNKIEQHFLPQHTSTNRVL